MKRLLFLFFASTLLSSYLHAKDFDSSVSVKKEKDKTITVEINIDSEDPEIRELGLRALQAVIDSAGCD